MENEELPTRELNSLSRKEQRQKDRLALAREGTLFGGWLSKYQHVERIGADECGDLLQGDVVVQEKLDGANLTVASDPEMSSLLICSRGRLLFSGYKQHADGFRGAVPYVVGHPGIQELFKNHPDWILRGEWLVHHTLRYAPENYGHFYVFDIQAEVELMDGPERSDNQQDPMEITHDYLHPDLWSEELTALGIRFLPVIGRFHNPSVEEILPTMEGPGAFGAEQKEGVVVKNYAYRNPWGRRIWGKLVHADFKEKFKLNHGAINTDPAEVRLIGKFVHRHFIMKEMEKIRDNHDGELKIQMMGEILGRVWHTLFTEELWKFVKEERIKNFNFETARRNCEKATREIALAYFNGLLDKGCYSAPPDLTPFTKGETDGDKTPTE